MNTKEKMTQARALLQAKRYDEARAILEAVDHPLALEWLEKIDRLAPAGGSLTGTPVYAASSPISPIGASPIQSATTITVEKSTLPIEGILVSFLTALVGGAALGYVLFFSSTFIYVLCFSMLAASLAAGWIIGQAIKLGKLRDGMIAVAFGLFMATIMYGTYRYAEYMDFRQEMHEAVLEYEPSAQAAEIDEFIEVVLLEETGSSGFIGYVKLSAEEGMEVKFNSRYSRSGGPMTLTKELTIAYWGLEFIVALFFTAQAAWLSTRQPFCEETNRWVEFKRIGRVSPESADAFLESLQSGHFRTAGSYLESGNLPVPHLVVFAGQCGLQRPSAILRVVVEKKRGSDTILEARIDEADYREMV